MFTSSALPTVSKRAVLSALATTTLISVTSISNAAWLENTLPTDKDAVLSVGVNAMAVNTAYDMEDNTETRVLPGVFYDNNRFYAARCSSWYLYDQ